MRRFQETIYSRLIIKYFLLTFCFWGVAGDFPVGKSLANTNLQSPQSGFRVLKPIPPVELDDLTTAIITTQSTTTTIATTQSTDASSSVPQTSKSWKWKPLKPKNITVIHKFKKHARRLKVSNNKSSTASSSNESNSIIVSTESVKNLGQLKKYTKLSENTDEELNQKLETVDEAYMSMNDTESATDEQADKDEYLQLNSNSVVEYESYDSDEFDDEDIVVKERAPNEYDEFLEEDGDQGSLENSVEIDEDTKAKNAPERRMTNLFVSYPVVEADKPAEDAAGNQSLTIATTELTSTSEASSWLPTASTEQAIEVEVLGLEFHNDFMAAPFEPIHMADPFQPNHKAYPFEPDHSHYDAPRKGKLRRRRPWQKGLKIKRKEKNDIRGRQGMDSDSTNDANRSSITANQTIEEPFINGSLTDLSKSTIYEPCKTHADCRDPLLCTEINVGSSDLTAIDQEQPKDGKKIVSKKCSCPLGGHLEIITYKSKSSFKKRYTISCGLGPNENCMKKEECASRRCSNVTKKCEFIKPPHGLFFVNSVYGLNHTPLTSIPSSKLLYILTIFLELLGVHYYTYH